MRKNRFHRILCVVLALLLLIGAWYSEPFGTGKAGAVTQEEIDAMKDEITGIANEIKSLENQLKDLGNDKAKALEQVALLNDEIELINQQIAGTNKVILEYDGLIAAKEKEIIEIEDKEADQYKLFCKQVRSMEERGSISYFSILFDAADFSDLLDRTMMISEIMDYNNDVINLLLATREELKTAKLELEESREDQQALRNDQVAARDELERREREAAELVQRIQNKEAGYEDAVKQLEAENKRIEEEMKQAELLLKAQIAGVDAETGFKWPVPGFYRLTSGFGWRTHPVYGTRRHHNGTDIASPGIYGTPIYAAKSGVVTTSLKVSSYGNYVVVSHSDGYQTLYAHMSRRAVSVGDVVKQGDILGYVGNTGVVTGTHLHYEVWYKGERTDAELYYPNLESVFVRAYNGE